MKQPIQTKLQKRYTAPAVALKIDVVYDRLLYKKKTCLPPIYMVFVENEK